MTRRASSLLLVLTLAARAVADVPEAEKRGMALYQAGNYAEAAVQLEIAYSETGAISIGFALAQSLRLAGNCTRALVIYRQVFEKAPPDARPKLTEAMQPCVDSLGTEVSSTPLPPPPAPVVERPWYGDGVGAVLVGSGALSLGIGGFAFMRATGHYGDAREARGDTDYNDAVSAGDTWRWIGIGGVAVGGALVAAGIVRFVIAPTKSEVAIRRAPSSGAVVTATWHW